MAERTAAGGPDLEAFRYVSKQVGLVATLGFALAFWITMLEGGGTRKRRINPTYMLAWSAPSSGTS